MAGAAAAAVVAPVSGGEVGQRQVHAARQQEQEDRGMLISQVPRDHSANGSGNKTVSLPWYLQICVQKGAD